MLKLLLTLLLIIPALSAHAAPDPALIRQLADEDSGVRISAGCQQQFAAVKAV